MCWGQGTWREEISRGIACVQEDEEEAEELHPGVQLQHAEPTAQAGHILSVPHLAPAPPVQAMVEWPVTYQGPPLALSMEAAFKLATDEQRFQTPSAQEMLQRTLSRPPVEYGNHIPDSPAEPAEENFGPLNLPQPVSIPFPQDPNLSAQPTLQPMMSNVRLSSFPLFFANHTFLLARLRA